MTAAPVVEIRDRTGSEMGLVQTQRLLGRAFVEQEVPGAGPLLVIVGPGSQFQVAVEVGNRSQIHRDSKALQRILSDRRVNLT